MHLKNNLIFKYKIHIRSKSENFLNCTVLVTMFFIKLVSEENLFSLVNNLTFSIKNCLMSILSVEFSKIFLSYD